MHKEMEYKLKDICEMKETLTAWVKTEMCKGVASCQAEELGEVVDMIKDLAEAEKCCYEACYYKSVIKAMEEYEEDDEEGRMGYNSRRYASGRYAPAGHGHLSGYTAPHHMGNWPYMDSMDENMRMGYRNTSSGGSSENQNGSYSDRMGYSSENDPRYGSAYNQYKMARRHYTSSNSPSDKEEMNRHANDHVADSIATFREIYKTSDPELKKRMKSDLSKLIAEMPV